MGQNFVSTLAEVHGIIEQTGVLNAPTNCPEYCVYIGKSCPMAPRNLPCPLHQGPVCAKRQGIGVSKPVQCLHVVVLPGRDPRQVRTCFLLLEGIEF